MNVDTLKNGTSLYEGFTSIKIPGDNRTGKSYTLRPVNAAILYCIKAFEPNNHGDEYSTEEIKIGTWIDGKPIYRRMFEAVTPPTTSDMMKFIDMPGIDRLIDFKGNLFGIPATPTNYIIPSSALDVGMNGDTIYFYYPNTKAPIGNKNGLFIIEYTKTTD